MDLLMILIAVAFAGICGALAQVVIGFSYGGMIVAIMTGIVGAFVGMWFASLIGLPSLLAIRVGTITIDMLYGFLGSLFLTTILEIARLWLNKDAKPIEEPEM
jgi:uncharacterized membrane protein YeaQ/YmgE (transglycosylase-associated protein family)